MRRGHRGCGADSGPRVRLPVDRREALGIDVRVALSGLQGGMTEDLLDRAQVRPALQEVRRRRMPERMGGQIRYAGATGFDVKHLAHDPGIDPAPALAEEQGSAGSRIRELGPTPIDPLPDGLRRQE